MSKRRRSEAEATDAVDPSTTETKSDPQEPSKKQKVEESTTTTAATTTTPLFNFDFSSKAGTGSGSTPLFNFNFDTKSSSISSTGSGLFGPASNTPLFPGTSSLFSAPGSASFLSGPSLFSPSSIPSSSPATSVLSAPSLFSKTSEPTWKLDFLNKQEEKPKSDLVIPDSTFGANPATATANEEETVQGEVNPVDANAKPAVVLNQVSVETGEEEDVKIWNSRAKCYELTTTEPTTEEDKGKGPTTEYKERGTGPIYLSWNKKADYYRLIMRADVTLKVLINARVGEGFKYENAAPKMVRLYIIVQDGENKVKPTTLVLRMSRQEDINELIKEVDIIKAKTSTEPAKKEAVKETTASPSKEDTNKN